MARLLAALIMLALIILLRPAHGDGPPGPAPHPHPNGGAWIGQGGYRNAAGELCCGEKDCFEISADGIEIRRGGYFVKGLRELVPFGEAQPSPDGRYWRCQWGGQRKCFFAPPPGV